MSGRSRRKKLVRSKRLSKTDSAEADPHIDEQPQDQQQQQHKEVDNDEHNVPALEAVNEAFEDEAAKSSEDEKATVVHLKDDKHQRLAAAAASAWRAAADMATTAPDSNPKWRRAAVRAVQLQDVSKLAPNGDIPTKDVIPPSPPQHQQQGSIAPPPGPWGEKVEASVHHVDLGKVVGVLRAVNHEAEAASEDDEDDDSTFEDGARHDDDSLVMPPEPQQEQQCATCNSNNPREVLDESLCGDPLMYATFVAPVHQYSTETEPSRQASFNYPSRQPSFKQNSSEADGSQPDILQPPHSSSSQQQPLLGVPSASAHLRASLTPPDRIYVDEVQDIYTEVPPEWPLPPVPPRHNNNHHHQHILLNEIMHRAPLAASEQDCLEISHEELERQVQMERLSFISGSSANEDEDEDEEEEDTEDGDEDHMANMLPPPPLPPKPPLLLNQQPRIIMANSDLKREATPMIHQQQQQPKGWYYADPGGCCNDSDQVMGTVRRKIKRERNRTTGGIEAAQMASKPLPPEPIVVVDRRPAAVGTNKVRSKSRSPGRSFEDLHGQFQGHPRMPSSRGSSRPCSHHASRGNSPDNISESSASFHENELVEQHKFQPPAQQQTPRPHHHGGLRHHHQHQGSSSSSSSAPQHPWNSPQYANRDSVRESWISSGSSDHHVLSGREQHHRHQHHQAVHQGKALMSSGGTSDASNKSIASSGGHKQQQQQQQHHTQQQTQPHFQRQKQTQKPAEHHKMAAKLTSTTLPRSAQKQSILKQPRGSQQHLQQQPTTRSASRESGSSSSRTVSRSGSRCGLVKAGSASFLPKRSETPEDLEGRCSPALEFPSWMHQPSAGSADLTELECMAIPSRDPSEAVVKVGAILANLQQRFKKDQIYTNIGTVLLSINPHKKLPLYTPDAIDIYRCHCLYELPPHIYAVTDRAWRSLRDMNKDQCLLFAGESGSGKTEAMKLSLQYLAAITGHSKEFHQTKFQILQSNIILEAFGNARTRLNDNSSRFGKYMEVFFDFKGDPTGAHIKNYLLEKSRVTRYPNGERNFHIFYQLLAGADIQLLKELRLQRNVDNYALLRRCSSASTTPSSSSKSSSTTSPSSKLKNKASVQGQQLDTQADTHFIDRTEFLITKKAMEDLDFSNDEINDIFRIISAVLKLGNINFIPTTNMDGTDGCAISNDYELYDVCEILKGEFPSMQSGLTSRSLESARADYLVTDLSVGEAIVARDALCRSLYSRLFTWLATRINDSIKLKTPRKCRSLGLLDLYGFEPLQGYGGFEQLVFNFAAEKVQRVICEWTFVAEQQEYIHEGVEWTNLDHVDNSQVVGILERGSYGVLSILEEVCMSSTNLVMAQHSSANSAREDGGSGTSTPSLVTVSPDDVFLERLSERFGSHPCVEVRAPANGGYSTSTTAPASSGAECSTPENSKNEEANTTSKANKKLPPHCFSIKHFGGSVTYDSRDFVSRNRDVLDRELSQAMYECDHSILKVLFPEGNPRRSARRRPATAGTQFKISLGALLNNLGAKMPHYVRCIRPNDSKQPKVFDMPLVQHQITYQGLAEMSQLRRQGYVFRMEYDAFLARYKMLSVHTWPHWTAGGSVDGVTCLLRDLPISANEYAFGRTKIFIRTNKTLEILEELRRERIDELATLIQKIFRGYRSRQRWNRVRQSTIVISHCWKRWKDKSNVTELKLRRQEEWATIVVQKYFRLWQKRRFLLRLAHNLPSESPLSKEWPAAPRHLRETNVLLKRLYHKWRCQRYRQRFDQIARNRMREKVTASIIFKNRKASYPKSISHPFLGDYVRLRQNPQWKKICIENNDQYVVFADIINKITRTGGKFVPILFVISTSSMLIMDQRTMQIKYRIPAAEIFKLSLSPYHDDIAVFHVRASSPTRELRSQPNVVPGCLSSEGIKRKGDFVLQTGHVIEIVTKLFLVVQNATGKPPHVNLSTEFDANFGAGSVTFNFKRSNPPPSAITSLTSTGGQDSSHHHGHSTHVKLVKRGNKIDIFL